MQMIVGNPSCVIIEDYSTNALGWLRLGIIYNLGFERGIWTFTWSADPRLGILMPPYSHQVWYYLGKHPGVAPGAFASSVFSAILVPRHRFLFL